MQRQAPRHRNRGAHGFDETVTGFIPSAAPQRDRLARIARNRAQHIEPDTGIGRRRDGGRDAIHVLDARGKLAHRGGGEYGETAHSREYENAFRLRLCIKPRDAFNEIRAIGEIEVIHAGRHRCLYEPIRITAVHLEWPGCIDHNIGLKFLKLRFNIAVAVETRGDFFGPRRQLRRERFCLLFRPTPKNKRQPAFAGQKLG
jgi:hypothetical protein